jgi:hypothetical protein
MGRHGFSGGMAPSGVPPGLRSAVLEILRSAGGVLRRRKILEALEQRGHRLSLAGLNRLLDETRRDGATEETPDGVRLLRPPP